MTSYIPATMFRQEPGRWHYSDGYRFPTEREAQAALAELRQRRDDLIETKIIESPHKATWAWHFEFNKPYVPAEKGWRDKK